MLTRSRDSISIDEIALKFYRLVLPVEGHYVAAIKLKSGGFKHEFCSTIEELWAAIKNADRDGYEAYHACASFKEPHNDPPGTPAGQKQFGRSQRNALGAKSFWLDIDVGPGKSYRNLSEALDALAEFCRLIGLPPPIVVSSGSGLHVYLPLQQMLDPATWTRYARGLKYLCQQYGLKADHVRTSDISSVLRTPGTHNRKGSVPRAVECDPKFLEIEPYPIKRFALLADLAEVRQPAKPAKVFPFPFENIPEHLRKRSRPRRIAEALNLTPAFPAASGLLIAERCGQVRAMRDKKGCLREPLWYAVLCVLAFCEDGDERGQEWSSGHENYTERETQERLDRGKTLSGATTCQRFHSLHPETCLVCPHWGKIKSPIVLGISDGLETDAPKGASAVVPPSQRWELTHGGALKPKSYINTAIALHKLGIKFRHDIFHNKKIVEGDVAENLGKELSDSVCRALREQIIARFGFDPGIDNVQQAAERACEATRFDPVLDYLNSLQWDGRPRLDQWLTTYLGAENTALNHSIGRKLLIAMVRRARRPGCKFDYVVVLEGKQGTGKSSALRILAGEENFSDQPHLHLETRAQQEATEGVWIHELSELAGLRRTEIETVKGFLSKTADNARPAYGRFRVDQPRRVVFVGTTNDTEYLRDATGNRRFWPVKTGTIDLDALSRDRDQLWAEAVAAEAEGEVLTIGDDLHEAALEQQDERLVKDPWDDLLAEVHGEIIGDIERISSEKLLRVHLGLSPDKITDATTKRLGNAMRRIGWFGPKKMRFGSEPEQGAPATTSIPKQGYRRPYRVG